MVLQGVEDINPSGKSLLDATALCAYVRMSQTLLLSLCMQSTAHNRRNAFPRTVLKRHQAQSEKPLTTPANMAKIKGTLHSVRERASGIHALLSAD